VCVVLPESGNPSDNLAVLTFPQLSRKPALKTHGTMIDPTLRDPMENGMETTRARYTRMRRQWEISIDMLKPGDVLKLQSFVERKTIYGAQVFLFPDPRDPKNPQNYQVRFSTLPAYTDSGNVEGEFRQDCTFTIREV